MILCLPRSGSDWLVSCICAANHHLRKADGIYEFFNPKLNPSITTCFGSQDHVENIAKPWGLQFPNMLQIYQDTWCKSGLNFDKEVWSFSNVGFFAERFGCICLYRGRELVFPGSMKKTRIFYKAIYDSLLMNREYYNGVIGEMIDFVETSGKLDEKLCSSHMLANILLLTDCEKYGIPVVDFGQLVQFNEWQLSYLIDVSPIFNQKAINYICKSRKFDIKERTMAYKKLGLEVFCENVLAKFADRLSPFVLKFLDIPSTLYDHAPHS